MLRLGVLAPVVNGDATRRGGNLASPRDSIESLDCRGVLDKGLGGCRSSCDRWLCGVGGMLSSSIVVDMKEKCLERDRKFDDEG
jgi:hypothetical protein